MIRYLFSMVLGVFASLSFLFFIFILSIGVGLDYTYFEIIKDSYIFILCVSLSSPLVLAAVECGSKNDAIYTTSETEAGNEIWTNRKTNNKINRRKSLQ